MTRASLTYCQKKNKPASLPVGRDNAVKHGSKAFQRPAHALRRAQVSCSEADAVAALRRALGDEPLALVALFVSSDADFPKVIAEADIVFAGMDVAACTTAGEIGSQGYEEGIIVAVGFPSAHFASRALLIEDLNDQSTQAVLDRISLDRVAVREQHEDKRQGFALLMVDGMSLREDTLAATIAPALRDMPLFGGSAGDGLNFQHAWVALNGKIRENAAVLSLIQTDHLTHVFSIDHLVPSDEQMVVTDADPDRRIVKEINAEPAAREYARIVGKNPDQLDQFTFASHPVVVRIGNSHHVRAIQQVNDAGELVFFAAIDEGMVLTLAAPEHLATHLQRKLSELDAAGQLTDIVSCDCILRRIEAEQTQVTRQMSDILARHRVIGFSTYGEQIGPLHVNHTMTGVAIYANPDASDV